MSAFLTLLKLQCKLRIAVLKPQHWLPSKWNAWKEWRPLLMGLVYLALIGISVGTIIFMENGILIAFSSLAMPEMLLSLTMMLCMILTLVLGFFHVTSTLYFSRDSGFLAYLPASSKAVMASKLAIVLAGEIGITFLVFLPACILYGIHTAQSAIFYVKAILCVLFIPLIPMAISTLGSTLLIRFSSLFRHRDRIAVVGGIALLAGTVLLQMKMVSTIPDDAQAAFFIGLLADNQRLLQTFAGSFPPVLWATVGLSGSSLQHFWYYLLFASSACALMGLALLWTGGRYQKLAISQQEAYAQPSRGKKKHARLSTMHSPTWALFILQWREVLRTPAYALNGLIGIVMLPIMAIAFMLGQEGEAFQEIKPFIDQILHALPPVFMTLGAAGAMALVSSINPAGATAVSREGNRHELFRMLPVSNRKQVLAKQLFGFSILALSCLFFTIVLLLALPSFTLYILAALVYGLLFAYFSNAGSLALDIMHPKFKWRSEMEAIKQNMNAMISMFLSALLVIALGFLGWGLWELQVSAGLIAGIYLLVLAGLAWGSHYLLMRLANTAYASLEV